jgi:hypothetical protein
LEDNILGLENVTLWFAKDNGGNIITIDGINENNRYNDYHCPMCGSSVKPKAIDSYQVTEHFAHVDASKCNSETMIHWWFKNKFLEHGDIFKVVSDKERQYVCKEVLIEQTFLSQKKVYKPDITVLTECGKTIYFEMDYSNKKKLQDYIDIWLELKNIVVEVDIKKLINKDKIPTFNALFYNGKCFNTKKNDLYYNTIGKYKEKLCREYIDDAIREKIKKIDWFWNDVLNYKKGLVDIEHMISIIEIINQNDAEIIEEILSKSRCSDLYDKYQSNIKEKKIKLCNDLLKDYTQLLKIDNSCVFSLIDNTEIILGSFSWNDSLEELKKYITEKINYIIEQKKKYDVYIALKNNNELSKLINNIDTTYHNIDKHYKLSLADNYGHYDYILWFTYNNKYPPLACVTLSNEKDIDFNNINEVNKFLIERIENTRLGKTQILDINNVVSIIKKIIAKYENFNGITCLKYEYSDECEITLYVCNRIKNNTEHHWYSITNSGIRFNYDKHINFLNFGGFSSLYDLLIKLISSDLRKDKYKFGGNIIEN